MSPKSFFLIFCILFFISIVGKGYSYYYSLSVQPNYLYLGQTNLKQHLISAKEIENDSREKIFFLGSSSVAGNNYPIKSTLADYYNLLDKNYLSFNLGSLQATILEAYIYYKMARDIYRPKIVFLGLDSDLFPSDFGGTDLLYKNIEILQDKIPEDIYSSLLSHKKIKYFNKFEIANFISIPYDRLLNFKHYMSEIRTDLYGHMMSKNVYGKKGKQFNNVYKDQFTLNLITQMKNEIEKDKGELVVYLVPEFQSQKYISEYQKYYKYIEGELSLRKINWINLNSIFSNDPKYFVDYIHLTPEGHEGLAKNLFQSQQGIKN